MKNNQGSVSIYRCCLISIGIPMLKIRLSHDRLIFNMGIPIPGKDGLYIEMRPSMRANEITLKDIGHIHWYLTITKHNDLQSEPLHNNWDVLWYYYMIWAHDSLGHDCDLITNINFYFCITRIYFCSRAILSTNCNICKVAPLLQ